MADAAHALRIKYGLANDPNQTQVHAWARLTREHINTGMGREAAGDAAAQALFTDYRTRHYASEADTIEALLRAIENQ